MDSFIVRGETSKCCKMEPLVESLAWPLSVIKQEDKEESAEAASETITEVWIKEEFEIPLKEETLYEEDPLAVSPYQVSEARVKDEWGFLTVKTEEVIIDEEESDAHNFSDQMSDVEEPVEDDSSRELTNHSSVFPCQKCEVAFTTPLYRGNHEKFCRGPKQPAVIVKPSKVTTDIQTLGKVVDGKQMYCCELCNYQTKYKADMKKHLPIHTGERAFQCEVCRKRFTEMCVLRKHKLVHSKDKPYKCSECSYASKYAHNLKLHFMTHAREKVYRFACKVCKFKTAKSSNLKKHMKTHSGEKPFSCSDCEFNTAAVERLKIHIKRRHTDDKPFSCVHCEYKAAVKQSLNRHMKRNHPDISANLNSLDK